MELINMASGAAYFQTAEIVQQAAINAIKQGFTSYGPTEGLLVLREAIAQRYQEVNKVKISPDKILITTGVKQALFNLFRTVLKPGDEVIAPEANWFGFHELIGEVQAKLVILPTSPDDEYTIHPEVLAQAITSKTRLFILCNPGNPTSRIYSEADIENLLSVLNQHPQVIILSDEIYDFVAFTSRVPSLLEFNDEIDRFAVVNGFSKSFAMSGWRIGYLIVPERYYQTCYKFQENTISGVSPFIQIAAAVALQNYQSILEPMHIILVQNRNYICSKLQEIGNISFNEPQATYYVFADLSFYLQKKTTEGKYLESSIALCQYLKAEYALELLAGDYFGAPGFARISFALEPKQLKEALERLQTGLHALHE
ncbi:pyridoxal phosphate-dependent aminotransferase [Adhaeribacter radiodurans]|uniref:Aminotransferase n=1 Tax=Adhaeribacter radiodurans TaxID=2745197 RepID=A0A7L7L6R9_9BACT|nr:aminotransferase class I/II-fold pyridoxal phosphate-dependent enzyme [Adhaeribacter radiodurans]QMU28497.1 aminotransferase class I/II-fold pyridoxal phosphate-dependent enzyme [Adhaeribacter radiodurans]